MLRILLKVLAGLVVLVVLAIVAGPFLISAKPSDGLASNAEAASAESRFVGIPFAGTAGLAVHYLKPPSQALPEASPDATAFLLLHGFTFNAWTWQPVLDAFAARGRTVAYDQLPYGLSAKPMRADWEGPNPYSKDAAITQLFAVMDALGLERAVLVGNSSGGTLALEAALAHPERVSALILVAPWVYATRPTLPEWLASLPQMRRLSLLIARKLGENGALLDLSYADASGISQERRAQFKVHTRVAGWDLAWGELLALSLSAPVTVSAHLAQVTMPVLLISGDMDRLVPIEDSRRVAEALPNATFAVIEGCGHVPQEECPDAFETVVSEWLDAGGL
ncbi:alpha/beta fold hydrolase [Thiocapsa marina]|uniref:Alpha/beta hydrolase fold protein n=1 Tax=Thiocapsa marina 5811 TaxID=768671 RepID=F9U6N1_9GAMM|nr:alpha/beta hydrolase [Thiocapsa marina]EGV19907.1 alpha/beta hydrolase fold protein [Thiocapsa marina 5811]